MNHSDLRFKKRVLEHTLHTMERPEIGDDTFIMLHNQAIRLVKEIEAGQAVLDGIEKLKKNQRKSKRVGK